MRGIRFSPLAWQHFEAWLDDDCDLSEKIRVLIRDIRRDPFRGLGKPEPLKGDLKGKWSRRINREHRLIYEITDEEVIIYACRGHY